jgi:hypothetical protein
VVLLAPRGRARGCQRGRRRRLARRKHLPHAAISPRPLRRGRGSRIRCPYRDALLT